VRVLERWFGGAALFRQGDVEVREKNGVRTLHLGSETIQSAMRVERPNDLELSYTQAMMSFLLFVPEPRDTLMIGLGGGSLAKFFYHRLPQGKIRVVEISKDVVAVARSHFQLPPDDARLCIEVADGAHFLGASDEKVDVLCVDAYDGRALANVLTNDAFYVAARTTLRANGVLVMNLWSNDWAFDRNLQRIERVFQKRCLCLPAERPGNIVVLGFNAIPSRLRWKELDEIASDFQERLGLPFTRFVAGLRKMNQYDREGILFDS
jgi:spermidine synthase